MIIWLEGMKLDIFNSDVCMNSFVRNAAVEQTKMILGHEHPLKLSQRDAVALVNALGQPAKANSRLLQAASRYATKAAEGNILNRRQ